MVTLKIKSLYNRTEPKKFAQDLSEPDMCQKQFALECDVNHILSKYKQTGMITHLAKSTGTFGDFSDVGDYQLALAKIELAQQQFQQLPAEVRARFANNPAELITFLSDEKNNEEAYKYGLKIRPPKKQESVQEQMEKALENNDKKRKQKTPPGDS